MIDLSFCSSLVGGEKNENEPKRNKIADPGVLFTNLYPHFGYYNREDGGSDRDGTASEYGLFQMTKMPLPFMCYSNLGGSQSPFYFVYCLLMKN